MNEANPIIEPYPSILIESLRDIGYSFSTALADIIDNSIAAEARTIQVLTNSEEEPFLAVVDDGFGLSGEELLESMRMGSSNPREERKGNDLGRFGLGMKTASFSQCRKLTVASRKQGELSAYCWDLDHVVEVNRWELLKIDSPDLLPFLCELSGDGTVVLWESLDRVVGGLRTKADAERVFLQKIDEAADHLSLVFHRFMSPEQGYKTISIILNGRKLEPLDPFNTKHSATIIDTEEWVSKGVVVQAFTLPHSSKYSDKREYEKYGLPGGYLKNQGIYLYRARRLIIHGTWFNLAKKTALTQLCRVRIDIDNQHDEDWKIDVKKVSAQLPDEVRNLVRDFLSTFSGPSKKVYRRRGAKQTSDSLFPVWNSIRDNGLVSYCINRNHPNIEKVFAELDEQQAANVELLLRFVESGFPTEALFCDISTSPESITTPSLDSDDFGKLAMDFYGMLKGQGRKEEEIVSMMHSVEMFDSRWADVALALGIEEED